MIRLPAAQRWPALLNAERIAAVRRQVEIGIVADDQRVLAAQLQADLGQTCAGRLLDEAPDRGRSGEADDVHVGRLDQRRARLLPEAVHHVEHAGGQPGLGASRAKAQAVAGVSSDGLSTAAFPQSRAGNTFQATLAMGVLAAMMSPATPSGWRTVMALLFGHGAGGGAAVEAATFAGHEEAHLDRGRRSRPGRPSATCRSPACTIRASSSLWHPAAPARRTAAGHPGAPGWLQPMPAAALRAADTAAATSALPRTGSPGTAPVRWPDPACREAPPAGGSLLAVDEVGDVPGNVRPTLATIESTLGSSPTRRCSRRPPGVQCR